MYVVGYRTDHAIDVRSVHDVAVEPHGSMVCLEVLRSDPFRRGLRDPRPGDRLSIWVDVSTPYALAPLT